MGEEEKDLFRHLFVSVAEVDYLVEEGQEEERGSEAVGLGEVAEEAEADFVWEDGQVLGLEDL